MTPCGRSLQGPVGGPGKVTSSEVTLLVELSKDLPPERGVTYSVTDPVHYA